MSWRVKLMIHIFNRRELMITRDDKLQAEIRCKLGDHNIQYVLKTRSYPNYYSSPVLPQTNHEYRFYVKKTDYDFAQAILEGRITYENKGI